ncbi:MAG: hypothetical protein HY000_24475 [Planctomycetes bacterium]|nr:hypothetical protein [Planctomycetota bacterium]
MIESSTIHCPKCEFQEKGPFSGVRQSQLNWCCPSCKSTYRIVIRFEEMLINSTEKPVRLAPRAHYG